MATTATMAVDPLVEPQAIGRTRAGAIRIETIDLMRGLVIAIMVLDHVRDFFHAQANQFDPTDPLRSYPLLFATRWVTHLCAPTFVLLSGVSIFLQKRNGKTGANLARFLVSRGLWLVVLECTLVMFAWNFGRPFFLLQVIWAIGWSMVGMALLAQLPSRIVLAIGVALVGLSPFALPGPGLAQGGASILHHMLFGAAPIAGAPVFIAYAVVPWLGVMAIGFGLGEIYGADPTTRTRRLGALAIALLALFALVRGMNGYGDPVPWQAMSDPVRTALSFLNVSKYPPSPDYVLVTLGCSMLLFLAVDHLRGAPARVLGDFGRTPLFTYIAHLYIAHGLMLLAAIAVGQPGAALNLFSQVFGDGPPQGWGWSLPVVYAVWLTVLAILVPLSRWFAGVKRRRRDWWLSYL